MDAYLASGSFAESSNFYFNLNFELLNGCQFNCKGCHVNKTGSQSMTDESYTNLMTLLNSVEDSKSYKAFIAFIAPTDFLSATNTYSVLTDKRVIEVLNKFKRISFQTTYLDISKASLIADILRDHYSDMELEINIIIEPDKIENEKYLSVLKKNQEQVIKMLDWPTKVRSFGIMNVFDYDTTKIASFLKDYDYMHNRVQHLFETTIDFNFSMGRKDDTLTSDEFKQSADRIKTMFNTSIVSEDKRQYLRFSFGRLSDSLVERQYNWKNGEFYCSPLLYERYVSFVPSLKIDTPTFKIEDFERFEEQTQLSQYVNVEKKDECESCPFLASCVDRSILHLMDIHQISECLVAKDAVSVVNSMGTLPYGN
jgi:hypothetical protein